MLLGPGAALRRVHLGELLRALLARLLDRLLVPALLVLLPPLVVQAAQLLLLRDGIGKGRRRPAVVLPRARIAEGLLAAQGLRLRSLGVVEDVGRHEDEQFRARLLLAHAAEEPLADPGDVLQDRDAALALHVRLLREPAHHDRLAVLDGDVA